MVLGHLRDVLGGLPQAGKDISGVPQVELGEDLGCLGVSLGVVGTFGFLVQLRLELRRHRARLHKADPAQGWGTEDPGTPKPSPALGLPAPCTHATSKRRACTTRLSQNPSTANLEAA